MKLFRLIFFKSAIVPRISTIVPHILLSIFTGAIESLSKQRVTAKEKDSL